MARYTEAAIGPEDKPERMLYASPEAARAVLVAEVKGLRKAVRDDETAENLNAVLDALEVAGDEYLDFFEVRGQRWTAWYRPTDSSPPGGQEEP